jgi:hypothetical protein
MQAIDIKLVTGIISVKNGHWRVGGWGVAIFLEKKQRNWGVEMEKIGRMG